MSTRNFETTKLRNYEHKSRDEKWVTKRVIAYYLCIHRLPYMLPSSTTILRYYICYHIRLPYSATIYATIFDYHICYHTTLPHTPPYSLIANWRALYFFCTFDFAFSFTIFFTIFILFSTSFFITKLYWIVGNPGSPTTPPIY